MVLKRKLQWLIFLCLTAFYTAGDINFAKAQNFSQPMSAADFAAQGDEVGQNLAKSLRQSAEGKIICGNVDTMCDTATQYCLRCQYTEIEGTSDYPVTKFKDVGVCVDKSSIPAGVEDLRSYWPSGYTCPADSSDYISVGHITMEAAGFLNESHDISINPKYEGQTFHGADGKEYKLFIGDKTTIQYGDNGKKSHSFEGCEVLPVKIYNMQSCFFCPLAAIIFEASNDVTITSFNFFTRSFKYIIIVVFAIWLAVLALQQVFPMTKQDAPKFLSSLLKQAFKVMIAILLLSYSGDLFRYFIIPVLDGGLQMGTNIQSFKMAPPENWTPSAPNTPTTYYNLPITAATGTRIVTTSSGKQVIEETYDTLYSRIEIYLASLQTQLARLQAIGTTLFCVGSHEMISFKKDQVKDSLEMMLLGGILTVFGFLLTISFAFYFMDAILQLAVIGAMLPFMIAGWPLRATAQYASTGFKMLLNTFFVLFFTGFVVSVNVELINQAISDVGAENVSSLSISGLEGIAEAINNQNISELKAATDIGGMGFLILVFCCIFGFKFVSQVSPLASTLSSGGFKGGLASKIGTMGYSAVKGMAGKMASPIAEAATDKYHEAGGLVGIVSSPVAGVGSLVGKAVGGADQEGKSWKQKSFRGKVGAAIAGVSAAPRRFAKKVHSVYRKPKSGN